MQSEDTAEANPSADSDIAMGKYLALGTTALQACRRKKYKNKPKILFQW
jgi:hypothetical protein